MNTICNFPDINIYLLYYLNITNIMKLTMISKSQNALLLELDFVKELLLLKKPVLHIPKYTIETDVYGTYIRENKNTDLDYCIVDEAAKNNYLSVIIWMHESINNFNYTEKAINATSSIAVLNWFKDSGLKFKYDKTAVNGAPITKLKWLKKSGYEFLYDTDAIDNASSTEVLDWFDKSGYEFKYSANAISNACENGSVSILDWFDKSDYDFLYYDQAITLAVLNGARRRSR